ncbi:MAG: isoamylase early set domain-containing protein [Caldilineaceae bacterium]
MIRKSPSAQPHFVHVVFELPPSIWADRISLVGDFNDWNPNATPFVQARDGAWRVDLELPANRRFRFYYLVDGRTRADLRADAWAAGPGRVANSVVETRL